AADGRDWVVDDDSLTFDRVRLSGIAATGTTEVIVGCAASAQDCSPARVWVRTDTWQAVPGTPFGKAAVTRLVGGPAGLLAEVTRADGASELWSSHDGRTWTKAGPLPALTSDSWFAGLAATDTGFVAVTDDGNLGLAWTSPDGVQWTTVGTWENAYANGVA